MWKLNFLRWMRRRARRQGARFIEFFTDGSCQVLDLDRLIHIAFHNFRGLVLGFTDVLRNLRSEVLKNLPKNRKISVRGGSQIANSKRARACGLSGKSTDFLPG
ncbi:MAG: hypothetical protein DME96_06135 [Verrucomicrobia bacterium]|nr:MAG: hypothetical protein DME96_06135 [Verrucomicrobiota bacterium]